MKNKSIWESFLKHEFKSLNKDLDTDVLIIGGGIAGLLTAYSLKNSNLKVTIVERNKIFSGVTSKMTAKVTILEDILTKISEDKLDLYLKSQLEGLNILKNNINNLNIECDFKSNIGYLYTSKKSNIKKLKNIETHLKNLNIKFSNCELPIKELNSLYSISIDNSYEINIIKYLNNIIDNLNNTDIYEDTNIIEVKKENKYYVARTKNNIIKAKIIVFASNYPYFIKPLLFPLKVRLEKSYIMYGKSNYNGNYNLINIDKKTTSIRFYKNKIIYLTNSKYISHTKSIDYEKSTNNNLINNIDNCWTNMDLITNDYLPLVGKIYNNMYIITGFNTWGILSSHIGSSIIANTILKHNRYLKYQELFNPRRNINLKKIINSSVNIYENMNGFFKGIINKNNLVYYSKDKAIYIDSKGNNHVVNRKCPHLKCKLIFNSHELTWDCPCHGSRFNLDGKVINGPSKYDIS